MSACIYYPQYSIPELLDPSTARWLRAQQMDGPLEVSDVTDVCAGFGVSAILCDEFGQEVGKVDAKGNYTLKEAPVPTKKEDPPAAIVEGANLTSDYCTRCVSTTTHVTVYIDNDRVEGTAL